MLPDLFDGASTENLDVGFAMKDQVGWEVISQRAVAAVRGVGGSVVLAGISMGAGVVSEVWSRSPGVCGILLLHAVANIPAATCPGIPIQVHIGTQDPFFPQKDVRAWMEQARAAALAPELYLYDNAGHYFVDSSLPDYREHAASMAGNRCASFLDRVRA